MRGKKESERGKKKVSHTPLSWSEPRGDPEGSHRIPESRHGGPRMTIALNAKTED